MKKLFIYIGITIACCSRTFSQSTCSSAQSITAGTYVVPGINGVEVPSPVCSGIDMLATAGMWYKYTPSSNFYVTVTSDFPSLNPNVDNRVHIYTGTCDALICVAGDDDSGTNFLCVVNFNVVANNTYYIAFDNLWSNMGFTFELIESQQPPAPSVSFQSQEFGNILGQYKIAVADMNGDYLDDIVSVSPSNIYILYQQPNGSFDAANISVTTAQFMPTWSMAIGDYNKDGFNDLMYGSGSGVSFYRSNSSGTGYTHFATSNFVFSQRTNFVDINNDGHLDAFACHDVAPNVYYLNDGNGNLSFHQGGFGDYPTGGHYATIWFDYNNDGHLDVFISKCSGGGQGSGAKFNELYRNNGDGTYTNVSIQANMNHPVQTWSSAVNDFDNDGFMDVIVGASTFTDGGHLFMRNNGDGTFSDITAGSGWDTYSGTSIEYVSYDFNNDGFADVFTNGRILINNGNNTFTVQNVTPVVGAVGDLNNDGFLDIQNGNTIYFNQPNNNNWIKMNLQGIESNSNGIGARVEIYGAWGKQIRDVQSGIGFRYMGTLNPHFGLGQATAIDSVIVRWPSGKVDLICNPEINTSLFIQEGSGLVPIADFSSSATSITSGDVVSFTDLSTFCPTEWSWEVVPSTGWSFVNSTNANSQNPQIQFVTYGWYTVSLTASNANGDSQNSVSKQIFVESASGLDDSSKGKISLYPNPTNDKLFLLYDGELNVARVKVISTIGKEVLNFSTLPKEVDVTKLDQGTYFLEIQTIEGNKIAKFIVTH
jgi:PKD repeat protein